MMRKIILTTAFLLISSLVWGQMFPERSQVRKGNRQYEKENYTEAEAKYMGALSKNPLSYEGNFNLGNSYFRQGRLEEAEQRFQQLGEIPNLPEPMAETQYNLGNTYFEQQKLKEALEAYKQSLRLNPNDQEAKFNLAYVQKLLEDQENDGDGDGDGENDQDNDQDQNQDQNQDDNQDPDQNDDPDNQNQDQPDQPDQNQQPQPQEGRMSREEAERMLDAVQNNEDQTREKVDKQKAAVVEKSRRNW